jgi:tetratricopeptide (TPR) repeat protein
VRRVSNRIRVNVQLIEAASNAHIWADRYDRDLTDVFQIQDEITRMVVAQVAGHARSALARRNRSLAPDKLSAYDYLLRARQATSSLVSTLESEPLLRKAIEIDPDLAIAHAILAHLTCIKFYYDGNTSHLADAIEIGQVALRLDPEEPWANYALAIAHMFSRRMRESRQFIDRALSLNSNEVNFLATDALWLTFMGEVEPALKAIDETLRRDPIGHDWFWDVRGTLLASIGKYREALDALSRLTLTAPWNLCYIAICYLGLGNQTEAKAVVERFKKISPHRSMQDIIAKEPYANPETAARLIEVVRCAEMDQ